jgi:hypothetical protein
MELFENPRGVTLGGSNYIEIGSRVLIEVNLMGTPWAYSVMAVTILIDIYLLYIFFGKKSGVRATTI